MKLIFSYIGRHPGIFISGTWASARAISGHSFRTELIDALPGRIVEAQTWDVEAVSGASITSGAIRNAVKDCLAQASK